MRSLLRHRDVNSLAAPGDYSLWLAPLCRPRREPLTPACCCPAPALFEVLMPPTPQRPAPVGLLLCGHHYRESRSVLRDVGSWVYDVTGRLVEPSH